MAVPGAPKKHSRSQARIPVQSHQSGDEQQIYLISDLNTANDVSPDDQVFQEETYEILAALDIDPQWMTVEEAMNVQSGSPHFFVTPVFRGKLFDHLESCNCKVLGTSLIRKCLQEGQPIPKKSHPIFSSSLRKTKICFTGLSKDKRQHLTKLVRYMDGVAEGNLYPTTTHLVTEKASYSSNKYRAAKTTRIPILRPEWIEQAWKDAQKLSDRDFTAAEAVEKFLLPVFNSMVICTSGISGQERQDLVRLIELHGGKSPGEMKKGACTHLVTEKTTGEKYLQAKKWGNVDIVTVRWIRKCVELGYVQDEKKFDPAKPAEPVAKNSTQKPGAELPILDLDTSSIYGPLKQTVISFVENNTTGRTVHSPVTPFTMQRTQSKRLVPSDDEVNEIIRSLDNVFDATLKGDFDFFEGCCIFVAGVDKTRQEKINRVLDRCGATRVNVIERATHIVVTAVKDSERRVLIEAQSRGVAVLRSDWLFGCIDGKQFIPTDEYVWDQNRPGTSPASSVVAASRLSIDSVRTRVSGVVETPRAGTHNPVGHMDIDFTEPLDFHACATSTPKITPRQSAGRLRGLSTERFNPRFHLEGVSQLVAEMPSPVVTEEEDSLACITVTQMGKKLAEAAVKTGQAYEVEPFRAISDQTIAKGSRRITEKELYKTTPRREKEGTVAAKPAPSEEAARSDQLMQKQIDFLAQTARPTPDPTQPTISSKRKRPHEMIADSPALDTVKRVSVLEPAVDWHSTITHVHQEEDLVVEKTNRDGHASIQEVRDESLIISMEVPFNATDLQAKPIVITDHFSNRGRESSGKRPKENVTPPKLRPLSTKPTKSPPPKVTLPRVFMFTGLTAEEKEMCEEEIVVLGGRLAKEQNDIPDELTHLICGKLVRGSKLMGCIASGRWILTTEYLGASKSAGKFLPEERFEWGNPQNIANYRLQGREDQLAKASLRWRLALREDNKKGVFTGWRVILYASRDKEKGLVPLLKAGDATVTTREKMTCSIAEYAPTHVIPVKADSWTKDELKQVVDAGAKVFPLEYISNLLIEESIREEDSYHRDYQVFLDCIF